MHIARETAGAARTRSSLRPLFSKRDNEMQNSGRIAPRECEVVFRIVGWVERRDTHRRTGRLMGIASLHPSDSFGQAGRRQLGLFEN